MRNLFSRSEKTPIASIFVLTNEESITQKIVGTLQEVGYQVQSATSAQAAMDLLDQPPVPDLFILDLFMPEMDTSTFLGTLRQRFGRADLAPVLLLASGLTLGMEADFRNRRCSQNASTLLSALRSIPNVSHLLHCGRADASVRSRSLPLLCPGP